MFSTLVSALALSTPASSAVVEAVDAAAKLAAQTLEGQFLPGSLSYSAPAIVGGRIGQGKKLTWPFVCTNMKGYPYTIFVASQKRSLFFEFTIKDSKGAVVARSTTMGDKQTLSFTPRNQQSYTLQVETDTSDAVKSAQVAAVIVEINGTKNFKSSDLTRQVRGLMSSLEEGLGMGQDFVMGKNLCAIALSPLQGSWTYAGYFDKFPVNAVAAVKGSGGQWTVDLKDSGGPNPQTWGSEKADSNLFAAVVNTTPADLAQVSLFFKNNTRQDQLYMVGLIK